MEGAEVVFSIIDSYIKSIESDSFDFETIQQTDV